MLLIMFETFQLRQTAYCVKQVFLNSVGGTLARANYSQGQVFETEIFVHCIIGFTLFVFLFLFI